MSVASPDLTAVLASLVCRVPGALGAVLLNGEGVLLARSQGEIAALEAAAPRLQTLLRRTLAAAARLGQASVEDVWLEAERRSLALIPLRAGCCCALLLRPEASPGRALFEARRTAAALNRVLG